MSYESRYHIHMFVKLGGWSVSHGDWRLPRKRRPMGELMW